MTRRKPGPLRPTAAERPAYKWPVESWPTFMMTVSQLYAAAAEVQRELNRWPLTNPPMEVVTARVYAEVAVDNALSVVRVLNKFITAMNRARPDGDKLPLLPDPVPHA